MDLPAPLSPTSAVTFPGSTAKSTPFKTSTAPKDFSTPSNSITGNGAPIFTPIIILAIDKEFTYGNCADSFKSRRSALVLLLT